MHTASTDLVTAGRTGPHQFNWDLATAPSSRLMPFMRLLPTTMRVAPIRSASAMSPAAGLPAGHATEHVMSGQAAARSRI